jgi:phosphate uptake regulator
LQGDVAISEYVIPGVGKIVTEKLSNRSIKVCAEIADYSRICLTLEVEPLREGIEKEIEEMFSKYESMLINGFIAGLSYVATLMDIERRAEKSNIYM